MARQIKKLSIFVSRFIPQHIQDNNPKFVDFVTGYIKFLESTKGPFDVVSKLLLDEDISASVIDYKSQFHSKYATSLPNITTSDEVNVFKQIRDFYRTKGTEDSFKWLFRAYYGSAPSFYYPTVDILRCSDGKWYSPIVLHVSDLAGVQIPSLLYLIGKNVLGSISGDSGIVDGITSELEPASGNVIPALMIVSSSLQFVQGEELIISGVSNIKILPSNGSIILKPGSWKGSDGHLSSNKMIQDNNYYQDMSYQLNVPISSDTFRNMTKHAIHPAGRKMFAVVEQSSITASATIESVTHNIVLGNIRLMIIAAALSYQNLTESLYPTKNGTPTYTNNNVLFCNNGGITIGGIGITRAQWPAAAYTLSKKAFGGNLSFASTTETFSQLIPA